MKLMIIATFLLLYKDGVVNTLRAEQEVLDSLYQLQALDDEFGRTSRDLFNMIRASTKMSKKQKEGSKNVHLAGSVAEGASIARIFKKSILFEGGVNREVEVDIEYDLFELTNNIADHVVDIKEKIGYVKLESTPILFENARKLGWEVSDQDIKEYIPKLTSKDGWFQPYKIKDIAREKVELNDPDEIVRLLVAAAMETKKKHVEVIPVSNEVTKSSVASDFMLRLHNKNVLKVSFDTVPLIKLSWNPGFLTAWKTRPRKWPSKDVIDELVKVGYIIAKPSASEKLNVESVEMRYAFAHFERSFVQLRSKHQHMVYLTFKIMFTRWIKPINEDKISSFVAKTVMFWTCEEFPPDHLVWQANLDSTLNVLRHMFSQLSKAFKEGYLPYYFNREINVIETVPYNHRTKVVKQIDEIMKDMMQFLPVDSEKETEAINEILVIFRSLTEVLQEFNDKDFSRLLKQPELISDVLKIFIDKIDLNDLGRKVEEEVKRFGKKVEKEAKRFGKKVEKEAKRFAEKAEKELKRFAKRFGL